jgi:hypothetical protein
MKVVLLKATNGLIALATVIVIALFLITAGILLSAQGNTSISTSQSENQADRAQSLAQAGIQDALVKISRVRNYSGSYTLSETDGAVTITVVSSSPMLIDATSTVIQNDQIVQWTLEAQVTLDPDGTIISVTTVNK